MAGGVAEEQEKPIRSSTPALADTRG